MTKIIFDMSISLDGFVTADGSTPTEPLGNNGMFLHEWAMQNDGQPLNEVPDPLTEIGAIICGKVTFDVSYPFWGESGPHAPRPLFVVTHEPVDTLPENDIYHFVPSLEVAVQQAKEAAKDLNVRIMGGPSIGQQAIKAGLADELVVHIVPMLFGKGMPLFGEWDDAQHSLKVLEVKSTPLATHIRYEVAK